MEAVFFSFFSLALITLAALASPGPDFLMTFRNSSLHSRQAGVYTALGITLGAGVHVTYILLGIGTILLEHKWLLSAIKYMGSGYLIYLGYQSFKSGASSLGVLATGPKKKEMSNWEGFKSGFIANIFNPKAILFFLGVFTLFIGPKTKISVLVGMGAQMLILSFLWFSSLALFFSNKAVAQWICRWEIWIHRITGVLFLVFGARLFFVSLG